MIAVICVVQLPTATVSIIAALSLAAADYVVPPLADTDQAWVPSDECNECPSNGSQTRFGLSRVAWTSMLIVSPSQLFSAY